jgi:hypothetical protein
MSSSWNETSIRLQIAQFKQDKYSHSFNAYNFERGRGSSDLRGREDDSTPVHPSGLVLNLTMTKNGLHSVAFLLRAPTTAGAPEFKFHHTQLP